MLMNFEDSGSYILELFKVDDLLLTYQTSVGTVVGKITVLRLGQLMLICLI